MNRETAMRSILRTLIPATVLALASGAALAADWAPPGPIKMMVAFRAGGGADTHARLIAEELEARHGWKILPEEVAGKGGLNMAAALKDAPADGTTIGLAVTETFGYAMAAAPKAGMSPTDFTPIATTAGFQMGVVAKSDRGWANIDDALAAAKAGDDLRFGVMSPRLADLAYLLGKANEVEFNIVSLRGGKAVFDAINAGDVDMGFVAGIQTPSVAAGDMINLASALSGPLQQSPDAPLLAERGLEYVADGQFVFMAPAGLPDEARAALADAILAVTNDSETKVGTMIAKAFGGPVSYSGAELDALIQAGYDESEGLLAAASE